MEWLFSRDGVPRQRVVKTGSANVYLWTDY
jgi:hypothetical protein